MTFVEVNRIENFTISDLAKIIGEIETKPEYQRNSGIWNLERKRLLIDSIVRAYDIPKLYFRKFVPMEIIQGRLTRYSVIDGQQRINTIIEFLNDDFSLDPETDLTSGLDGSSLGSRLYSQLYDYEPSVARRILNFPLDVVTIETDDLEIIEDMFLRLNEAAPLNAAEKRNAFGGPVPGASHRVAAHPFFSDYLRYSNARYRHYDMATKFIYFEYRNGVADTKKAYLDRFVKKAIDWVDDIDTLVDRVILVLDAFNRIFIQEDPLLRSVGMASVYYLVFKVALENDWIEEISRASLMDFETRRVKNRNDARDEEEAGEFDLNEFDRLSQSPNDAIALRFRRDVLLKFLGHPLEYAGEDNG